MNKAVMEPDQYLDALRKVQDFALGSLKADFPNAGFESVFNLQSQEGAIAGVALTKSAIAYDFTHSKGERPLIRRVRTKQGSRSKAFDSHGLADLAEREFPFLRGSRAVNLDLSGSGVVLFLRGMVFIVAGKRGRIPWAQRVVVPEM